jgi:hypothetical protein
MQLKYFLVSGNVPHVHAAGFFLFVSFLIVSLASRKSFCSWLCPVGTASEYLWKLGRATFRRNFQLPRWADIALRSLKYALPSFFAYAVAGMSAAAIAEFLGSPSALIVDVRMLNFFRYLGGTTAVVLLGIVIASIFVQNFWCRYLCTEPFWDWSRCSAQRGSPATSVPASIAPSAPRRVRRPCRLTNWCRSAPPSAPDAWSALRSVPQKTRW